MMSNNNCSNENSNGHVGSLKKGSRAPQSGGSDAVEGSPSSAADIEPASSSSSGLSRINRFADYFVICGLDLDTGLEPDRFSGEYTSKD